jgi:hypothetical protein
MTGASGSREPRGPRARPPVRRRLAVAVLIALASLVAAELSYRGWLRFEGRPYDAARARREVLELDAAVRRPLAAWSVGGRDRPAERIAHPYFGWELEVNRAQLERWSTVGDPELAYDVVVVGGSVAAAFVVDAGARLEARLAADARFAGRAVRVVGLANGAFKQPQQLHVVSTLLARGLVPDAVVNLDGFNELAIGARNAELGAHPLHPALAQWAHLPILGLADGAMLDALVEMDDARRRIGELAERMRGPWLGRSAILGRLTRDRAVVERRRHVAAGVAYAEAIARRGAELGFVGPPFDPGAEAVQGQLVRGWTEASRSLHALCEARGVDYVHVLQPTLHDADSKPLTPEEVAGGAALPVWIESVSAGYPRLREAGERLRAEGVAFVDGSGVFRDVTEPLYVDACHFAGRGARMLAEHVARGLIDATR